MSSLKGRRASGRDCCLFNVAIDRSVEPNRIKN